jgi:hypothetical protein
MELTVHTMGRRTLNNADEIDLTIQLDATRVGCQLDLRVVEELRLDRSGWNAMVFVGHKVGTNRVHLLNTTIDTEVIEESVLPALKLALAGREFAGDKETLDAIELLLRGEEIS